jgi:hypothetical protein
MDFDAHYVYHTAWAARKLRESDPEARGIAVGGHLIPPPQGHDIPPGLIESGIVEKLQNHYTIGDPFFRLIIKKYSL